MCVVHEAGTMPASESDDFKTEVSDTPRPIIIETFMSASQFAPPLSHLIMAAV